MQSGIAYAAGQLLAVVAPRTVLVVDAPTDWSLAGPLWELALDDAPVDEILDVLVRRGIRTAPSFAIVRVEADAVRALVRGSVPVCFERIGEPVRLDATGATTWLEGLISGARRVLVGAVETGSSLPYHVSTGVVLVSGLALTCGPVDPDERSSAAPGMSELGAGPSGDGTPGSASSDPVFAGPVGTPVGAGAAPSGLPAGREPRVVDLTRSGPRTPARAFASSPAPRDSWALSSARSTPDKPSAFGRSELNGHVPAVLDPLPTREPSSSPEPERVAEPSSLFEPSYLPGSFKDDPGELLDVDGGRETDYSASPSLLDGLEPHPSQFADRFKADQMVGAGSAPSVEEEHPEAEASMPQFGDAPEELNSLLADPAEEESPRGPSPADLPNLDPPSVSLQLPAGTTGTGTGVGVPAQPRGFNGVPAAWPPAFESSPEQLNGASPVAEPEAEQESRDDERGSSLWDEPIQARNGSGPVSQFTSPPTEAPAQPDSDQQQSPLGELPLRVRGRSLRPEQSAPVNGAQMLGQPMEQAPPTPAPVPPFRPASSTPPEGESAPASGSLLLPAFFRGARAARAPGTGEVDAEEAVENAAEAPAPPRSPWTPNSVSQAAPAAWVPPVRRGFPDRSGFNGGPPAMPGVLRPSTPDGGSTIPAPDDEADSDLVDFADEPTESSPGPDAPDSGTDQTDVIESDSSWEPPRLLGVWCDAGHVTSPDREECRVCGLAVPPQAPILVARPPLGVLIFDNGDRVEVDRPVILGRDPKPPTSSDDSEPPLLHPVTSATGQVSRTHAEVRASGWDVILTDLDAMNGTALTLPGATPVAIEPGIPTLINPGARVDLGGESGFIFEVEG